MKLNNLLQTKYKLALIISCFLILYYNDIYLKNTTSFNDVESKNARETIMKFYNGIKEFKIYSKNYEDGVTLYLLKYFSVDPGVYLEVSAGSGFEFSTRILREMFGWSGLLLDPTFSDDSINLKKEEVTPNNVLDLLEKYKIGKEIDFIAVESDYAGKLRKLS